MKYGLIGEKLGHSYSVPIHKAFGVLDYELRPITRGELGAFLTGRDFLGLNVTIPYKTAVMPYCGEIDARAQAIGCVNTLVIGEDGVMRGYNTDYSGFELMAAKAGISFEGRKVLILGTGGTSKTAHAVVRAHGARDIVFVSREGETNYDNVYSKHPDTEIIINTTPVGMYPLCGKSPIGLERFVNLQGVLDVVYNPRRTAFQLEAEKLGLPHSDGLIMLVEQARLADELYTGRDIPPEETDRVCRLISQSIENIILTGMPGSGKTSIGQALAEKLGREFFDSDDVIVSRAGMSIPDIFSRFGEEHFRSLEREVISELGAKSGVIIATGGGVPVDPRNHAPLRQNGRIYHIERDLSLLALDGRPLSTSLEALREMQVKRAPFYAGLCDRRITNDGSVGDAAEKIMEDFLKQ